MFGFDGSIVRSFAPGLSLRKRIFLPSLTTVLRAKNATFVDSAPQMPHRGDVCDVRIFRMNADSSDLPRIARGRCASRFSAVHRLINAVAVRHVAAHGVLRPSRHRRCSDRSANLDRANRAGLEKLIGHGRPICSGVGRFPNAAACRTEIINVRIGNNFGNPHRRGRRETVRSGDTAKVSKDRPFFRSVQVWAKVKFAVTAQTPVSDSDFEH